MKVGIHKLLGGAEKEHEEETLAFLEKGSERGDGTSQQPVLGPPSLEQPGPARGPAHAGAPVLDRVVDALLARGFVTRQQVQDAEMQWRRTAQKDTLWRVLAAHPGVNRDGVYAEAARIYAFREEHVAADTVDGDLVRRVIESFSSENKERLLSLNLLPLRYEVDEYRGVLKLIFATHDPTRPEALRLIHDLKLDDYELRYAPEGAIIPLLDGLFPKRNEFMERAEQDTAYDIGATFEEGKSRLVDEEALEAEINRSGLINLFEAALVEAVRKGVSDIHIFPNADKQTEMHFRIDGHLQLWHTQDKVHPESMLAVIKDRCGNIDRFEREAAQDGFIQRTIDGALIRFRVSILPIAGANRDVKAESIVIRVLDDRKVLTNLGQIGLLSGALQSFSKAIRQPHGMVILTGPTGSGKSTTLVAALQQVVTPKVNVLTVEDPVEYIIKGVRQIKLGSRINMDQAMRSILRHDPDIVMVGEMRDKQTAELAIKLANTGHLTFSTLHTNDAPSAVSRLYKMGIEPFLIAYAINLVVAQRLLRTLCPECKEKDHDPDVVLLRELGFTEQEIATTTFYKSGERENCRVCKGVGYKGRRAIAEALYFSRAVRHLIVNAGEAIDEDAIRDTAVKEGMLTLVASAREIVKLGQTAVEEVIRVTASE